MPYQGRKYYQLFAIALLLAGNIYLFYEDWKISEKKLTVAVLDVGQGDAIFVESPNGTQVLFDAGISRKTLGALNRVMFPLDNNIDALIITNPDADHVGGALDIIKNYEVGAVFEPGTQNDSKVYKNLKEEIQRQKIPNLLARKGMRLHLGDGVAIDILFPDRDVSLWPTNEGSVVARLSYKDISLMLMGDATVKTEKILLSQDKTFLDSDYLKVGHHGSRSSTSLSLLQAVSPELAFISAGRENNYGHPHQDVLEKLNNLGAKIMRTDLLGTIIMTSDGSSSDFIFHKQN